MKSIDNHINNPVNIKWVDPRNLYDETANVKYIKDEMYDRMMYHDPNTVYIITDVADDKMYLGDQLIPKPAHDRQYLVSYDEKTNSYVVYLNMISMYRDNLVPICRYSDPDDAIRALHVFKSIGGHTKLSLVIYQSITNYIDKVYGINEAIIGMIAASGYRDDPRLQYLNEEAIHYGVKNSDRDLPQYYRAALKNLWDGKPDSVIVLYSDIYDVFVKYDFFKNWREPNLSAPVNDILSYMKRYEQFR